MRLALALAAATLALPATAPATTIFRGTIDSEGARARACTKPLNGRTGVAQAPARAADTGSLRLTTSGPGDWDVAVFDRRTGRFIAGSAQPGSDEIAQGFVVKGQRLLIQACRFESGTGALRVRATTTPIALSAARRPVQVVAVHTPTRADKDRLGLLGLDPAEGATRTTVDVVLHDAQDARRLRDAGFTWTVKIADLAAQTRVSQRRAAPRAMAAALPSGRKDYRHLADYEAELKQLAAKNPGLVKLITLPFKSVEGRDVLGVEIAQNVNVDDGRPVFLQLGVHHAREWPAGEAPMEWAYELVTGNGKNPRVTNIVASSRTIVVPIVNPDGFNLSREATAGQSVDPGTALGEANFPPQLNEQLPISDPLYIAAIVADSAAGTFAYKRRNCRVADGKAPAQGECGKRENRNLGVDPNRNYGGLWGGPGASTDPKSDIYRGPSPFSEPETQNVRALVSANQVVTLITNHTFTGLVLRPPGVRAQGAPPDEAALKALGDAMAAQVDYKSQPGYALYDTTGTTEDWSYGATGGFGYTYEIGKKQFHPVYSQFIAEYEGSGAQAGKGLRGAYFLAAEHTIDATKHSVVKGLAPPGTILRLTKTFDTLTSPVIDKDGKLGPAQTFTDRLEDTITVGPTGSFEWHMNPSTRPVVARDKTTSEPADEPSKTQDASSQTPIPPKAPKDVPIEVPAGTRLVQATTTATNPADDYDIYLYEGSVAPENQVASSAGGDSNENLTYDYPTASKYILRIVNFAAVGPMQGTIKIFAPKPGTERTQPALRESYTLTCETPTGTVLTTNPVEIARGEVKTLNPCGENAGAGQVAPAAATAVPLVKGSGQSGRFTFKMAVKGKKLRKALRKGLLVRVRCNQPCRTVAAATVHRSVARRYGIINPDRTKRVRPRIYIAHGSMKRVQAQVKPTAFKLRFTRPARERLRNAKRIQFRVVGHAGNTEGEKLRRRAKVKLKR